MSAVTENCSKNLQKMYHFSILGSVLSFVVR